MQPLCLIVNPSAGGGRAAKRLPRAEAALRARGFAFRVERTTSMEHARELAESSPSIVTPLNKYIGYENAAKVAKTALKEKKTIRQVVVESGFVSDGKLTEQQLDEALDVLSMTRPGL